VPYLAQLETKACPNSRLSLRSKTACVGLALTAAPLSFLRKVMPSEASLTAALLPKMGIELIEVFCSRSRSSHLFVLEAMACLAQEQNIGECLFADCSVVEMV